MATTFFPLASCEFQAGLLQTALASSVAHLFQDTLTPDVTTPLADYTAAECDYSGYSDQTYTAWFDPILAEGSGYMIQSPWLQFAFDDTPGTPTNVAAGCYVVTSGGELFYTVIFTQPIPMQVHGQGIGFNLTLVIATGQ